MEKSIRDRLIKDSFVHFINLVNETFIPLCIEVGIKPTNEFILESLFRGCIPAESILKKVIAKEVYAYSGDYLSKQQLRREKIKNLQDTLIKIIKVLDRIKKVGIIGIWHETGISDSYISQFFNLQGGIDMRRHIIF